jgi:UPF0271 protein
MSGAITPARHVPRSAPTVNRIAAEATVSFLSVIELSCDLGEADDASGIETERRIWPMIHAANVACGGHAGDATTMRAAARLASEHRITLGAHPSYPDRANFGRKPMEIAAAKLRSSLVAQIASLHDVAEAEGVPLQRVKAHGALYNQAHADAAIATILVDAMLEVGRALAIVASDISAMAEVARRKGVRVVREAFADRRYEPTGALVSRTHPDALLSVDEAAAQASLLARERTVIARDGSRIAIEFDTICIHADMEHSVERLRSIRRVLES